MAQHSDSDTYRTIHAPAEGIYKEKGSKFLAFAYPVHTVEEIASIVAELKKGYYDARHHCFAWRLGPKGERFRAFDDGEPSSTAGRPILGQLLSNEVTDVLVVVVRYFGGTLLGASGLIRAYKEAASDALANAQIVEQCVKMRVKAFFTYFVMNDVMKIVKELQPEVEQQQFDSDCMMAFAVRASLVDQLIERLSAVEGVHLERINID